MANQESNLPKDKYTGMRDFQFGLNSNVYICGGAGAVLGLILAIWATGGDIGITAATVIVFAILSGIFGMFV
jgi:hypothetical protein